MKISLAKVKYLLCLALLCIAATIATAKPVYVDASQFPLYGQISGDVNLPYARLPKYLEGSAREPVWKLGQDAAGLFIRFRSNSTSISVRWTSLKKKEMMHMTPVGARGLDLYAMKDGQWYFAGSALPFANSKKSERTIIKNMNPEQKEFMLYLSLYDGVTNLEIGIDSLSVIEQPSVYSPKRDKPIVMYGTSILQGGCANRPGMAHTNIIGRMLNREVINLGFSGNARLDYEIAYLMASVKDPGVYVLDYVPNCDSTLVATKAEGFFRILRDAHPNVPIVFVENPIYPTARFDMKAAARIKAVNTAQRNLYYGLVGKGEKMLYYVFGDVLLSEDGEDTVDGKHFTDRGATHYSEEVAPVIARALRRR